MTPEERWVVATPAEMLELSIEPERVPMIVDDLRELPVSPLILAEGTTVRPEVVARGFADWARAVWLAPTPESAAHGSRRGARARTSSSSTCSAATRSSGRRRRTESGLCPWTTLSRWPRRSLRSRISSRKPSQRGRVPRPRPNAGRSSATRTRRSCRNAWRTSRVPGRPVMPNRSLRTFVCECDDPECTADVELAVAAFVCAAAAGPVLAPSHG
jgi:hypothetical protein